MNPSKAPAVALLAAAALAAGLWTALRWAGPSAPPQLESGILLQEPRPVAPFVLTDHTGARYDNARLQGRWTLLFAGFTNCPDVCPTTLALIRQLQERLAARGQPLQALFLSVDPERDTVEQLRRYVEFFGPAVTGVTGAPAELERLTASLGLAYLKVPGSGPGQYTMDHSAALVLLDPQGRIAGYFQAPHRLDTLAADLARILPRA
jgi:protein SCO1